LGTVKFSTSIILGIYTATLALWKYTGKYVAFMPIFAIVISIWAFRNVRRQYKRLLEMLTWINKIEKYLGLHDPIESEKRYFDDECHLIPERWLESAQFKTGDAFIKCKLKYPSDTMYGFMGHLFIAFMILSFILALITFIIPIAPQVT